MMNVTSAIEIFRPGVIDIIPNKLVVITLIPEMQRSWRQNGQHLQSYPSGIAFHPKHSVISIADRDKNCLYMANNHCPVCVATVTSKLNQPLWITYMKDLVIVCNSEDSSLKTIEITEMVSKKRALLQVEEGTELENLPDQDDPTMAGSEPRGKKSIPVITVKLQTCDRSILIHPADITSLTGILMQPSMKQFYMCLT